MPKKKSDTTRPSGRITAYAFFQKAYVKIHDPNGADKSTTLYQCGEYWKKMNEAQKEPWKKMEEQDRERYNQQLKEWEAKNPLAGCSKRHARPAPKRALKARDAPKHPLSAFFWWGYSARASVTKKYPGYSVCEISKILGEKWKTVSPDVRVQFELMAEKDKVRYRKEKEKYIQKIEALAAAEEAPAEDEVPVAENLNVEEAPVNDAPPRPIEEAPNTVQEIPVDNIPVDIQEMPLDDIDDIPIGGIPIGDISIEEIQIERNVIELEIGPDDM